MRDLDYLTKKTEVEELPSGFRTILDFGFLSKARGMGFVWIWCLGITFFSACITPIETVPDFQRRVDTLDDVIMNKEGRNLLGGHLSGRTCLT